MWLHSLKVAQLLRSAACLHTNQSRSYLNHLVLFSGVQMAGLTIMYFAANARVQLQCCFKHNRQSYFDERRKLFEAVMLVYTSLLKDVFLLRLQFTCSCVYFKPRDVVKSVARDDRYTSPNQKAINQEVH